MGMAAQSRNPVILLTRPAEQSLRFAEALREAVPGVRIVIAPLIEPEVVIPVLPQRIWQAVIFSSETAVAAARRIVADGQTLPRRAFCVGRQTAQRAIEAGFEAVSADGNGEDLFRLVAAQASVGPLLYLRGREARVDLAERLVLDGIETVSAVVYAQVEQALSAEAVETLHAGGAVVAAVFSPRTGALLAAELARIAPVAPVHVVAISTAAAGAFAKADVSVALTPDAPAMVRAIASRLSLLAPP